MPMMRTRAKKKHVASDRARRENVPSTFYLVKCHSAYDFMRKGMMKRGAESVKVLLFIVCRYGVIERLPGRAWNLKEIQSRSVEMPVTAINRIARVQSM